MKREYTRMCPKCNSLDVSPDLSVGSFAWGSIFNKHKCNSCGHTGLFFPEVKVDLRKVIRDKKVRK